MFKKRRLKKTAHVSSYFKPVSSMKMNNVINQADASLRNKQIPDSVGLSKAYEAENKVYVNGNRM